MCLGGGGDRAAQNKAWGEVADAVILGASAHERLLLVEVRCHNPRRSLAGGGEVDTLHRPNTKCKRKVWNFLDYLLLICCDRGPAFRADAAGVGREIIAAGETEVVFAAMVGAPATREPKCGENGGESEEGPDREKQHNSALVVPIRYPGFCEESAGDFNTIGFGANVLPSCAHPSPQLVPELLAYPADATAPREHHSLSIVSDAQNRSVREGLITNSLKR